ncbi:MAG TPA: hypothetical protein VE825_11585 [Terriglobales bacterium]|jgi:hypothetical protein|nr:hypothetical protein [Terriglobales bacterium]
MLLLKYVVTLAGLGILVVAAGLVLYDVALAVNFQRPVARGTALGAQASGPAFCRPAVFLYQRNLAERKARLAAGRVQRLRQSVRARRRAARS